jgi:hypothetical protein
LIVIRTVAHFLLWGATVLFFSNPKIISQYLIVNVRKKQGENLKACPLP